MRRLHAVFAAGLFLVAVPQAGAQAERVETKITLSCRDTPLREALLTVAGAGGYSFIMSKEAGELPVTLSISDVSGPSAVRTLVKLASSRMAGLRLNRLGDFYVLYRRLPDADPDFQPLPPLVLDAPEHPGRRLTASFINMPVGAALQQLTRGSELRFRLSPEHPAAGITLLARDLPAHRIIESLPWVLPGTTIRRDDGVYVVQIPGPALPVPAPRVPPDQGVLRAEVGERVTLALKDAPLRTVIDRIFAGSGLQYAIQGGVPDTPITLKVQDVSRQSALRLVVKLAAAQEPRLVMEREGDVYVFRLKDGP